jgi:hypothetical protein
VKPISEGFKPLGVQWWKAIGEAVILLTKDMGQKGIGGEGKWPGYSTKRSLKSSQHTGHDTYAEAKAAGAFNRQSSTQINPPNLELTGDLWRDFKTIAFEDNSVTIGFPTQGERASFCAEGGRPIFTKAGAPSAPARRLIHQMVKRKFTEQLNGTRGVKVIRVGK